MREVEGKVVGVGGFEMGSLNLVEYSVGVTGSTDVAVLLNKIAAVYRDIFKNNFLL